LSKIELAGGEVPSVYGLQKLRSSPERRVQQQAESGIQIDREYQTIQIDSVSRTCYGNQLASANPASAT
jgi:hypothetical protein